MTVGDGAIEGGAQKLERLGERAETRGGAAAKLGAELRGDAAFLRKLKPSLIVERVKGNLPKDSEPGRAPAAPNGPQLGARPAPGAKHGPNPFAVAAGAFAVGWLLAKIVDWRSHAHPKL
jgi:hypothetical protein